MMLEDYRQNTMDKIDLFPDVFKNVSEEDVSILLTVDFDEENDVYCIDCRVHGKLGEKSDHKSEPSLHQRYPTDMSLDELLEEEYPRWVDVFTERYGEDNVFYAEPDEIYEKNFTRE